MDRGCACWARRGPEKRREKDTKRGRGGKDAAIRVRVVE